jgi:hypothetical protein
MAGRIVFVLVGLAIFLWIWSAIFKKAGFPALMSLLMIVPVVNFFTLVYFAFTDWPIQAELARLTPEGERDRPTDRIDTMLRQAAALEHRGDWQKAAELFDVLSQELKGLPGEHYAATCAKRIRERHGKA